MFNKLFLIIKKVIIAILMIYTYNIIPSVNKNYNVNCILVEKRDNPKAVIYRIR